ncbi:MAG: glycosyltransferase [Chloroflexi bacterium]|nr:glycosyltransferase [Chloroflexota bacterium]
MSVLHVYKDYYPVLGGIENHIGLLCRELATRGVDVRVLVTNTSFRTMISTLEGVPATKAGRFFTLASTPISLALFREIAKHEVDIVHLHFPYPLGELAHLWGGRGRRLVLTYHSDIVRQRGWLRFYKPFLRRILNRADAIIVSSPQYISTSGYLPAVAGKCSVIPFGIDTARFDNASADAVNGVRQRYRPPIVLFVGKLRYYKGIPYLLEAMKQVEATLLVVGSGPMAGPWQNLVEVKGLGQKVIFLGEVGDELLPALYHASDVFVLPSCERAEAFGFVLLEAMACGLPVISTELGTGTSFVNLNGQTGLVVPPRDPDALAEAINCLLKDQALRIGLGQQARQRVEAGFTKEQMVEKTLTLYQTLLALPE